ncbi:MAG: hypothetical protein Q7U54_12410 [Bacteroidales bacterium]|nr:hypothetical protein [Bacteroidales bacterium]
MKLAILKNELDDSHLNWEQACIQFSIDYSIIDLTKSDWLDKLMLNNFDALLACPSGRESLYKQLYDERIYILESCLKHLVYPSFKEISIHENKRFLSYWLKANKINHPLTKIFYNRSEAKSFAEITTFPIVGKFNIGASGKGVQIIRNRIDLDKYIEVAFTRGLRQSWGPNLKMGGYLNRLKKILNDPSRILKRLKVYSKTYNELQYGFVIFQEYIPHTFEWRIVKIGNSFFGHQKVKQGDKASGTKGIDYIVPPDSLLTFVKELCNNHGFNSMAVDIFEDGKNGYLINELQCIFGHVQSYICEKDGNPGRFVYYKNQWIFEEGLFNSNLSYNLRLENLIDIIKRMNS